MCETLEEYKAQVALITEEPEDSRLFDTGLVLLTSLFRWPRVSQIAEFTELPEEFVHKVLWRADIYDLFNDIRWHENDIIFVLDAMVAAGYSERRRGKDGEWLYHTYGVDDPRDVDGRKLSQNECTAIMSKYELTRKEAWELWREKTIDIDAVIIDASNCNPFEPEGGSPS